MNKPNLNRLLKKWQKLLRLQDWDVQITYIKPGDLSSSDAAGEVICNLQHKHATIRVGDPTMFPSTWTPPTIEHIVIHELIHLHLAGLYDDDHTTQAEQAINLLTDAFITLGGEDE